jgi:hypothetical protein
VKFRQAGLTLPSPYSGCFLYNVHIGKCSYEFKGKEQKRLQSVHRRKMMERVIPTKEELLVILQKIKEEYDAKKEKDKNNS